MALYFLSIYGLVLIENSIVVHSRIGSFVHVINSYSILFCKQYISFYFLFRSIDRYLKDSGYPHSILKDDAFRLSRSVLASKRKTLKAEGKGNKALSADALSPTEEDQLWSSGAMGPDTPLSLLRAMWFLTGKLMGELFFL